MIISHSVVPQSLAFDPPSRFAEFCDQPQNTKNCVFHPNGGAANYDTVPDALTTEPSQVWTFNDRNQISMLGLSDEDVSDNNAEIIAFAANLKAEACHELNKQLGISGVPQETDIDVTSQLIGAASLSAFGGTIGGDDAQELNSQPFGCFQQDGIHYYYHVLIEQ